MRVNTALVLGAASVAAASMDQHVLGGGGADTVKTVFHDAESWWAKIFGEMTADARAAWDEVASLMPDAVAAFKKNALPPRPKKANRKTNWDYTVKGADVQGMWVNTEGEHHRKVGGRLEDYNLRAKKVDPSKLGVDSVKQYSGYLDDEANDKHLFYCKLGVLPLPSEMWQLLTVLKGFSSRGTILRTIPWSCG
jgi:cathepsin A (carboxypeptidase C)